MNYLEKFKVGRFYKNSGSKRFNPDPDRMLDYYDPDPNNYPTSTVPNFPMRTAMQEVLEPRQQGAWFLTQCNFNDLTSEPTADKFIPVFWPITDTGVPIETQGVAAPCPPFCQGDAGIPPKYEYQDKPKH